MKMYGSKKYNERLRQQSELRNADYTDGRRITQAMLNFINFSLR